MTERLGTEQVTKPTRIGTDLPLTVVVRKRGGRPGRTAKRRGVVALAVLLLIAGGIGFSYRHTLVERFGPRQEEARETLPAPPKGVFALGRLEPEGRIISVAAPHGASDARMEVLNVREGDPVHKGDVLAVLDNEARLKAAVLVAQETVHQAEARLARTKREVTTTRAQLQAALATAESRLATAQIRFGRLQRLLQTNASAQEDYDERELEVKTAVNAVKEAQARLDRYLSPDNEELVDIVLSRKECATAEASLEQARANLEQAYVRAPRDGKILRFLLRPGERIGQTPLLEMGATHQMMVRVEVYESDLPRVRIGQPARLTASPLTTPLDGVTERVSSLVRKQETVDALPAASTDARVVEVWVRLDSASSAIAANLVNLQVRVELMP